MVVNFGKFNFANVKHGRAIKYLRFLVRAAHDRKARGALNPVEEHDDRILKIQQAEKEFETEVSGRIDQIEKKISKTLYRLNKRIIEERQRLKEEHSIEAAKMMPIDEQLPGRKSKRSPFQANLPVAQKKKKSKKQSQIEERLHSLDDAAAKLHDVLSIKQKVRGMEDKLSWLRKRGYDSAALSSLLQRLHVVKDVMYKKIFALLEILYDQKMHG